MLVQIRTGLLASKYASYPKARSRRSPRNLTYSTRLSTLRSGIVSNANASAKKIGECATGVDKMR